MMSCSSLILLEHALHSLGHAIVLLANHVRIEHAAERLERIDGGIDAGLRDRPAQRDRRAEVAERGGDRGVGEVVGGHVDRLHRRDRALVGRGDPLLQVTHLGGESRLVADRRRHASEQRRHLGAGERVPEDVVDEEQRVGALLVAEPLGDGERR